MGKMPYLFFIAFVFWKLNPAGYMVLAFFALMALDAGLTIRKHRR